VNNPSFLPERGLPPLPNPKDAPSKDSDESSQRKDTLSKEKPKNSGLSFSSGKSVSKSSAGKRKAVGDPVDSNDKAKSKLAKKSRKAGKALLSFGDGDDA
jgi:hypothetical protein